MGSPCRLIPFSWELLGQFVMFFLIGLHKDPSGGQNQDGQVSASQDCSPKIRGHVSLLKDEA